MAQIAQDAQVPLVPLRRNRDFNLLWTGQAVSGLGSAMSGIAYPLLILAETGSAARAGLVGGTGLLVNLLLLLPAGVISDRFPRKRVMVVTSVVQLLAVGTVVPVVLSHHAYVTQLAAVAGVQGAASAFYTGASRGAIRRVVPVTQLSAAYARIQARDQATSLIGPPAGGTLFGIAQFLPFACDSLSFGMVALAAALIRAPLDPPPEAGRVSRPEAGRVSRPAGVRGILTNLTAGLRFVFGQPVLRTIAVWGAMVNATAAGLFLTVIVLARNLGAAPAVIGLLVSINAGCGLLGSVLATRTIKLVGGRNMALLTSWLLPLGAVGISQARSVWLIGVIAAVTTFTVAPVNVAFGAYSAEITPDGLQAQAGNAMKMCVSSLSWLTPPAFGAAIAAFGARTAVLIGAVLYALAAIRVQLARDLRDLDRPRGAEVVARGPR